MSVGNFILILYFLFLLFSFIFFQYIAVDSKVSEDVGLIEYL